MSTETRHPPDLVQRVQEIPLDHRDSRFLFTKNLVATRAAIEAFGPALIFEHYLFLQGQARRCNGLDYLQVFEDHANPEGPNLWFIEDGVVVTALLPSDY
jgi:hypothetical protein